MKLPKMAAVRMKLHRPISEKWKLKSVTVSREPSGKYFASLLFCCENQQQKKDQQKNLSGSILPCRGCVCFLLMKEPNIRCSIGTQRKSLHGNRESCPDVRKAVRIIKNRRNELHLCHEKIRNQRKDFQHKLSASLAESYDAVCVEDLNLKGMAGGLHLGKGVHDNGYGLFLSMLEYKLEERGKYLIKVDRYFASSKICSVCGKKKEELSLSDRIYCCECGNRMDRDVNAAVNIMNEGKRIFAECA